MVMDRVPLIPLLNELHYSRNLKRHTLLGKRGQVLTIKMIRNLPSPPPWRTQTNLIVIAGLNTDMWRGDPWPAETNSLFPWNMSARLHVSTSALSELWSGSRWPPLTTYGKWGGGRRAPIKYLAPGASFAHYASGNWLQRQRSVFRSTMTVTLTSNLCIPGV